MGRCRRLWTRLGKRLSRYHASRYPRTGTLCVATNVPHAIDTAGPESPQAAVQSCREAINVLNKQELSLQSQVHIAETEARALLRLGDRTGAETSLKKREIVLREIERLHRTRMSLLTQILLVETASTRQIAVEALASGVAAHRRMSHRIFAETQLEGLQDALIEQASFETEISELLGQGFDALSNFDDETVVNLKKSLAELEHDEVANALAEANYPGVCSAESYQGTTLPSVRVNPSAIAYPPDRPDELLATHSMKPSQDMATTLSPLKDGHLSATLMTTMASPTTDREEGLELWTWRTKADQASVEDLPTLCTSNKVQILEA